MVGDLPRAHSQEEGLRGPTWVCLTSALPADFTGGVGVGDEGPSCSLSLGVLPTYREPAGTFPWLIPIPSSLSTLASAEPGLVSLCR